MDVMMQSRMVIMTTTNYYTDSCTLPVNITSKFFHFWLTKTNGTLTREGHEDGNKNKV